MSDTEPAIVVRRPPQSLGLRVLRCGSFPNQPSTHPPGVVHGFWVAYIVEQAGMAIEWQRGQVELQPGDCWVVPPWLPVTYHLSQPVQHSYVVFETGALPTTPVRLIFDALHRCDDPLPSTMLMRLGEALRGERIDDVRLSAQTLSLAHLIIDDCLAACRPEQRQLLIQRRDVDDISPALDHIERHLDEAIAVAHLAEILGVSERYCTTLFRRHCDTTPMGYVTERRIQRACCLLADSSETINEIATRCGFPNRHYFSRVFTKVMGSPPATYRRGHAGQQQNLQRAGDRQN